MPLVTWFMMICNQVLHDADFVNPTLLYLLYIYVVYFKQKHRSVSQWILLSYSTTYFIILVFNWSRICAFLKNCVVSQVSDLGNTHLNIHGERSLSAALLCTLQCLYLITVTHITMMLFSRLIMLMNFYILFFQSQVTVMGKTFLNIHAGRSVSSTIVDCTVFVFDYSNTHYYNLLSPKVYNMLMSLNIPLFLSQISNTGNINSDNRATRSSSGSSLHIGLHYNNAHYHNSRYHNALSWSAQC